MFTSNVTVAMNAVKNRNRILNRVLMRSGSPGLAECRSVACLPILNRFCRFDFELNVLKLNHRDMDTATTIKQQLDNI